MMKLVAPMLLLGIAGGTAWAVDPVMLISYGAKFIRVYPSGVVESFPVQQGQRQALVVVPPGIVTANYRTGDVLAAEVSGGPNRVWRVDNPWSGTPNSVEIGTLADGIGYGDLAFADGRLYGSDGGMVREISLADFSTISEVNIRPSANISSGGLAFDGVQTWYLLDSNSNRLFGFANPPAEDGAVRLDGSGGLGQTFGTCDLEWLNGQLWGALRQGDGAGNYNVLVGTFDVTPGNAQFNLVNTILAGGSTQVTGLALRCASDFNADLVVDFFDYLDYVDAFAGNSASADFNADTVIDFFDYLDFVEAFSTGC